MSAYAHVIRFAVHYQITMPYGYHTSDAVSEYIRLAVYYYFGLYYVLGRLFRSQGAVYARRTLSTYAPVLISGSASAAQNNPSCGVMTASGKRKSSKLSFEDLLSVGEDGGQGGSDDDDDDDDDDFGANGAAAGAAGSGGGGGGGGGRFADMDEAELDAAEQRAVELAGGDLGSPPARSSRRSSDRMSTRRRSSAVLEDSNFRVKKMK